MNISDIIKVLISDQYVDLGFTDSQKPSGRGVGQFIDLQTITAAQTLLRDIKSNFTVSAAVCTGHTQN